MTEKLWCKATEIKMNELLVKIFSWSFSFIPVKHSSLKRYSLDKTSNHKIKLLRIKLCPTYTPSLMHFWHNPAEPVSFHEIESFRLFFFIYIKHWTKKSNNVKVQNKMADATVCLKWPNKYKLRIHGIFLLFVWGI